MSSYRPLDTEELFGDLAGEHAQLRDYVASEAAAGEQTLR